VPANEGRLLASLFVVLAAIAAATIFLDHKFANLSTETAGYIGQLEKTVRSHEDALKAVDNGLAAAARGEQLKDVADQLKASTADATEAQSRLGKQLDSQREAIVEVQQRLKAWRDASPDYRPLFDQLQAQLQQQATALAELKAQPHSKPSDAAIGDPGKAATPAPAVPGLPPELAHQVGRLADPDPAARFEAVDELLRSKNQAVREHLLPMAKDADTFVRRLVVEGLREFKRPECVDVLLTALADPEEIVRDTAWRSLKELTGQKLPFEASGGKEARARAQQKWQEWWDKNKAGFGS
jgi:hypothetical protein